MSIYKELAEILRGTLNTLILLVVLLLPLGVWKLIEIIIWVWNYFKIY